MAYYFIGAMVAIFSFVVGALWMGARLRRKLFALLSNDPSNPIFQAMFHAVVMPTIDALATKAEQYDTEVRCINGCGHKIAALIRSGAMEFFKGPFPSSASQERPK